MAVGVPGARARQPGAGAGEVAAAAAHAVPAAASASGTGACRPAMGDRGGDLSPKGLAPNEAPC